MITALETTYAGVQFRSRLEARWAVFFDKLEMPWNYEPAAFLVAGGGYLPDFEVCIQGTWYWFEVKNEQYCGTELDWAQWGEIAERTERTLLLTHGMDSKERNGLFLFDSPGDCDQGHYFCSCQCGVAGFAYGWKLDRLGCACRPPRYSDKVDRAYAAAKSARFGS